MFDIRIFVVCALALVSQGCSTMVANRLIALPNQGLSSPLSDGTRSIAPLLVDYDIPTLLVPSDAFIEQTAAAGVQWSVGQLTYQPKISASALTPLATR